MPRSLLEVEATGDRSFAIRGEIDLSSVDRLTQALDPVSEGDGDVVLDLRGLEFADSTGLRELIRVAQRLQDRGRLVLRHPTPSMQRFFDITGLGRVPNVTIELGGD